jgi:hypothetical protein
LFQRFINFEIGSINVNVTGMNLTPNILSTWKQRETDHADKKTC